MPYNRLAHSFWAGYLHGGHQGMYVEGGEGVF